MVRAKKFLGQHFLNDTSVAERIVESLQTLNKNSILEVGPGTGILTEILIDRKANLLAIELDRESILFLKKKYSEKKSIFIEGDFLKLDLQKIFPGRFSLIGNFPYNISSQILFKVLDNRSQVEEVVCMLQKEVADRILSPPRKKAYGILSVFLQAYYDVERVLDVGPESFSPPPKVNSAVIRLKRNETINLDCDEKLFRTVVKSSFQMRRKTLRNALKGLNLPASITEREVFNKRAEELSYQEFESLTNLIQDR